MTPRLVGDANQRRIICENLDESLLVEASAGTGKTTELVNRIVAVLKSGRTTVDRIAAVTFTHKAAGELKVRLRQELDEARQSATADELLNLEQALKHLEESAIGTIHSFCAQILRERPVEADVDPAFQDMPEQEQRRMYERAFLKWFQTALDAGYPGLRRALSRLAWTSDQPPAEQLQEAGRKLIEWRDFRAPWRREPFERENEIDALAARVRRLAAMSAKCTRPHDDLFKGTRPVRELATWMERAGAERDPDYDTLEGLLLRLERETKQYDRKGRGEYAPGVLREDVLTARNELLWALAQFKERADADLAAILQGEMQSLINGYDELKRRAGRLDFVDLLIRTRDLVRGNRAVREYLQNRFTHLFIDEFQDTDPLQAEILILLASDNAAVDDWRLAKPAAGKLFVVGDPKQSIYKFRRADVAFYQDVCRRLLAHGVRQVELSTSHRSLAPIQACVNAAFAEEMQGDEIVAQARYVPLEGSKEPIEGQPPVVVIPAPHPWGFRNITKKNIEECLPDAVCAWIEWLVKESGWKVRDPDHPERLIPVEARHVAVLFRRFVNYGKDITRPYVRSLEAREIPHLLVGSKSFHQREEVETLRAAVMAIEWPDDELSVYATLRGSLFAFEDALLFRYRRETGSLHPLRPPEAELDPDLAPVREALDILAELHRDRNRRPVAETVNRLLEKTRAHAGFALRPGGHQVLSNVLRVSELARGFEASGGISFRGFVEELAARADKSDSSEAPMMEPAADGVRLLTVHTAKGLEFPVVVLADMTANLSSREADRHIDPERGLCATRLLWCAPWELIEHQNDEKAREQAEGVRVAYVAATRARDLLVVPAVGDDETEGWLQPLNKAIYPEPADYRKSRPFGDLNFGDATVLSRPNYRGVEPSVKPGTVQPKTGGHEVVWWDPAKLKLTVEGKLGLRRSDVLAGTSNESTVRYRQWSNRRAAALESGATPEWAIISPSEGQTAPGDWPVHTVQSATLGERPSGRRLGSLVHLVMRDVDFGGADVERLAQSHGRMLGASADEVRAAENAVRRALAHSLLERARGARECYRELPVTLVAEPGVRMEGTIDLAFLEDSTWQIVDFKTDAHLADQRARYERQLRWYAEALHRLTQSPVVCTLLGI